MYYIILLNKIGKRGIRRRRDESGQLKGWL